MEKNDAETDTSASNKDWMHFAHLMLWSAELAWQEQDQETTVNRLKQAELTVQSLLKAASEPWPS